MSLISKNSFTLIICICLCAISSAQTDFKNPSSIGERIFLPALEVGYINHLSKNLSGGLIVKTSIEYRINKNSELFTRLNFDTYDAQYQLEKVNDLTNVISGSVLFSDLLIGGGYRLGKIKKRFFILLQPGLKFYYYPRADKTNAIINIEQNSKKIFTSRITLGFEYYINDKNAISLDILQNQIWKIIDFWQDKTMSIGMSIGFITALF